MRGRYLRIYAVFSWKLLASNGMLCFISSVILVLITHFSVFCSSMNYFFVRIVKTQFFPRPCGVV